MDLLKKIQEKKATVAIVGLGYVGLPLSIAFLKNGFKVIGLDNDDYKIKKLSRGKSYLQHVNSDLLPDSVKEGNFIPSLDFALIKKSDVIILCVPTPLNKYREPDLKPIIESASKIKEYLKKDQLVVLESSTYPGTTDEILTKELEKSGFKANKDFYISYSPEREDPGNKKYSTTTIPKIIGANTAYSRKLSEKLYKQVVSEVVTVSSSRTAEATKLTENIFRGVNIALVNELKTIYDAMGIDIWEVIDAASTKPFGYMPFYPGPGLGGHCIPIDPFYLTYKAKEYGVPTKFIELAGEINTSMPYFVVDKIVDALSNYQGKAINGASIFIIGLAYKNDIDDLRESPALMLLDILDKKGAKMSYHDEFIPVIPKINGYLNFKGKKSLGLTKKNLKSMDLTLIITNHSYLDIDLIGKNSNLIVDTRNSMKGHTASCQVIKA